MASYSEALCDITEEIISHSAMNDQSDEMLLRAAHAEDQLCMQLEKLSLYELKKSTNLAG
jgi:hypothetical protein